MTTVSVIITTHNRPHLLPRAIASARTAGRDVEIVVVDDASSDETARVCQEIENIRYVRVEHNQQVAGARNIGLVASHGQFITFLDDDDFRLPGSLDKQVELLERNPTAALVYGQVTPASINDECAAAFPATCPQGDIFWELLTRNLIPCGSAVFRRSCLERVGLLDDSIPRIDDWDLWLRLTELFPVVSLCAPVMIWRQATADSKQGSSNTVDVINLSLTHFRARCLQMVRMKNASHRQRRQAWRRFSFNFAEHLAWETFRRLRAGQLKRAFVSARLLLRLHPATLLYLVCKWASAANIKALITNHDDLETTKNRFKEIRSVPDNP